MIAKFLKSQQPKNTTMNKREFENSIFKSIHAKQNEWKTGTIQNHCYYLKHLAKQKHAEYSAIHSPSHCSYDTI